MNWIVLQSRKNRRHIVFTGCKILGLYNFTDHCLHLLLYLQVISYLVDTSVIMDDDDMYALSLEIEPRQSQRVQQTSSSV